MNVQYLAIENDHAIHKRESEYWLSRGVSSIRVSSMREGIIKASAMQFLYIGINASNIDYLPSLRVLREATNDPIFIATDSYTMMEQGLAVKNGADLFGQISNNPSENYAVVMANIESLRERSSRQKTDINYITYGDILVAPSFHKAFINDKEIEGLTNSEMIILQYLVESKGRTLTYRQIYQRAFRREYDTASHEPMYSAIRRVRRKIEEITNTNYIDNVWGVGYRILLRKE